MIDNYTVLKFLTKGEHSEIFVVQDPAGKTFASKVMYYTNESTKSLVSLYQLNELKNIRQLDNSKSIQLIASSTEGKHVTPQLSKPCVYTISSYYPIGPISNLISLNPSEDICKFFFKKIVTALESVHRNNIYHLNIRPENILIDCNLDVRFCGFSFATSEKIAKKFKFSVFTAPECLASKAVQAEKVDIFALGVVLFIMVCGHPPFMRAGYADQYFKLLQSKNKKFWNIFKSVSDDFKELAAGILKQNPGERFELEKIKGHRWLSSDFSVDEIDSVRRKLTIDN